MAVISASVCGTAARPPDAHAPLPASPSPTTTNVVTVDLFGHDEPVPVLAQARSDEQPRPVLIDSRGVIPDVRGKVETGERWLAHPAETLREAHHDARLGEDEVGPVGDPVDRPALQFRGGKAHLGILSPIHAESLVHARAVDSPKRVSFSRAAFIGRVPMERGLHGQH